MKDFVVYTIIVGGYDEVKQPIVTDDRFDYILFTDDISKPQIGVWQVREIPYKDDNLMRLSRYAKCLPTKVLPEYKASLYIDGTLQIATNFVYDRFIELYEKNVDWAGVTHYQRDCMYEEMCVIVGEFPKGIHDYETIEWYCKVKKSGFPRHFGLYENNVIYRIHSSKIASIGEDWWDSLRYYCKRDQFSLMSILWKYGVGLHYILPKGIDTKHTNHFVYSYHATQRKNVIMNFHEKVRYKCWRTRNGGWWYGFVLEEASKFPFPKYSLYEWEMYAIIRYWLVGVIKVGIRRILKYVNRI